MSPDPHPTGGLFPLREAWSSTCSLFPVQFEDTFPYPPASLHALNTAQSSADQQVPDGGPGLCQGFHHSPAGVSSLTPRGLRRQIPGLSWGDFQDTESGTEGSGAHTPRVGASCRATCVRVACVGLWSRQIENPLPTHRRPFRAGSPSPWPSRELQGGVGCGSQSLRICPPRGRSQPVAKRGSEPALSVACGLLSWLKM